MELRRSANPSGFWNQGMGRGGEKRSLGKRAARCVKLETLIPPFSSPKFLTLSKLQNMKIFNVFQSLVFIFRKYVSYLNLIENKE